MREEGERRLKRLREGISCASMSPILYIAWSEKAGTLFLNNVPALFISPLFLRSKRP